MSFCLSKDPSEYHRYLLAEIEPEIIYSRGFGDGTLYCVVHAENRKRHSTLDEHILAIDEILQNLNGTPGKTYFKSIGPLFSGKVVTYSGAGSAQDKKIDEYYRAIYNVNKSGRAIGRKHDIWPEVFSYPVVHDQQDIVSREQEDIDAQMRSEKENPGDYGLAFSSEDSMDGVEYQGDAGAGPSSGDAQLQLKRGGELEGGEMQKATKVFKMCTPDAESLETTTLERDEAKAALVTMTVERDEAKAALETMTAEHNKVKAEHNKAKAALEAKTAENIEISAELEAKTEENIKLSAAVVTVTVERDGLLVGLRVMATGMAERDALDPVLERDEAGAGMMTNHGKMLENAVKEADAFRLALEAKTAELAELAGVKDTLAGLELKLKNTSKELEDAKRDFALRQRNFQEMTKYQQSCMDKQTNRANRTENEFTEKHDLFTDTQRVLDESVRELRKLKIVVGRSDPAGQLKAYKRTFDGFETVFEAGIEKWEAYKRPSQIPTEWD